MASQTYQLRTNLRCQNCLKQLTPHLDQLAGVTQWHVQLDVPEKWLHVDLDGISVAQVAATVEKAGYKILDPLPPETDVEPKTSYWPIALIVIYLLAAVACVEFAVGRFELDRAMRHFMGGFFIVFSFFKMLNIPAFADSYAMYDLLAARSRVYALAYPFIEFALGAAYLLALTPVVVNSITLGFMLLGTAGVLNSLMNRRRIRCACLGAVFNLPMSYVTLIEDLGMALMAAIMLWM